MLLLPTNNTSSPYTLPELEKSSEQDTARERPHDAWIGVEVTFIPWKAHGKPD